MSRLRSGIIRAAFNALHLSGLYQLMRPISGGVGAIFLMHHVRPQAAGVFRPNGHLEITPEFLRATLRHVRSLDIDIVSMDEASRRMADMDFGRRFACFGFDDGYRDNRDHALPVMREFAVSSPSMSPATSRAQHSAFPDKLDCLDLDLSAEFPSLHHLPPA